MKKVNGQKRVIPASEAPAWVRGMAAGCPVVEWTNPDGGRVYWFVVDGVETRVPPSTLPGGRLPR